MTIFFIPWIAVFIVALFAQIEAATQAGGNTIESTPLCRVGLLPGFSQSIESNF